MKNMKKFLVSVIVLSFLITGCKSISNPQSYSSQELKSLQETRDEESKKLVKAPNGWIYYLALNNKRYIFPTTGTFKSWFGENYYDIKELTLEEIGEIALGGNVTYRPGSRLIQTPTDPKIYYVEPHGVLRPFENEEIIEEIYGKKWKDMVDDLENYYFTNYRVLEYITDSNLEPIPADLTIDQDKGFDKQTNEN